MRGSPVGLRRRLVGVLGLMFGLVTMRFQPVAAVEIDDVLRATSFPFVGWYTLDYSTAGITAAKGCHNQSLKIGTNVIFSTCTASDGAYMFVHNLANPITYKCHVKSTIYGDSTHVGGSVSLGGDSFLTVLTDDAGSGKMRTVKMNSDCSTTDQYIAETTPWGDRAGMLIRSSSSNGAIEVWNYESDVYSTCDATGANCGAKVTVPNPGGEADFDAQECMQSSLGVSWSHVCSGLPGFDTTAQIVTTKFSAFSGSVPMLVNGSQLDFEGLDYQKVGSNPARIWAASHAAPFATGGSCGPLGLAYPCTDTQGRQWIHKFSIDGPAASPTPTPTPTPVPVFSNVSASLGCTATFNFSYSGTSPSYRVDLGLNPDLVVGTYLDFGAGTGSPITVTNPAAKWSSYTHGRTLYYRVYNSDRSRMSTIKSATVNCPGSAPTPTPTPAFTSSSATLGCTASFSFVYTGYSPSYSVDLSLTSNFSSGVYLNFASGTGSPLTVSNPTIKWWNSYTQGRTLYYRIWNSDRTRSRTGSAVVNCTTPISGTFSGLSATLGCTANFNFTYSGYSPSYIVDLSLTSSFASGVYLSFGTGSSSPVAVTNPKKWTSYTYGRTLYYRIHNSTRTVSSPIYGAVVTCP